MTDAAPKPAGGITMLVVNLLLAVVNLVLWVIDTVFPPTKMQSPVPLDAQSVEQADGSRRSRLNDGRLLVTIDEAVTTLYENFRRGARMSAGKPCLGTREGGVGQYIWQSYDEVVERLTNFGSGLVAHGVAPGQQSFVGLYSINRAEWVIAEQACNAYSMITVPLYDTLGLEAVKYILGQTNMSVVVVEGSKMPLLLQAKKLFDSDMKRGFDSSNAEVKVAAKPCPLKLVIKMEALKDGEKEEFEAQGLGLVSMAQVEAAGKERRTEHVPPKAEDIATICYTSGTTGNPKGAMLLHRNLIADMSGAQLIFNAVKGMEKLTNDDSLISFLPLAHMFERIMQTYIYFHGARVGFYTGDPRQITNDMLVLKPTVFPCVPRLLNRVHALVMRDVEKSSPIKRALFAAALKYKHNEVANSIVRKTSFWDRLVFAKIHAKLGGRVKLMITGAAPISAQVLTDLRAMLGCNIFEGYGQTEGTAGSCITLPGAREAGNVGPPLPCNEIKLADVEDMGLVAVRDNRGEICYRGPNIFIGYLNDPNKTKDALDADGWLHSGDVGTWLPNGALKLVDRKKSIFKLAQGEYVAPEKIENVYTQDTRIAQAFVWGDSHQASLVAIFVVDPPTFSEWAASKGYKGDVKALVRDPEVTRVVCDELNKMCRAKGLQAFECAKCIRLIDEPFTVENGLLTPTFKTKRPQLTALFGPTILKELIAETHKIEEAEKKNLKG